MDIWYECQILCEAHIWGYQCSSLFQTPSPFFVVLQPKPNIVHILTIIYIPNKRLIVLFKLLYPQLPILDSVLVFRIGIVGMTHQVISCIILDQGSNFLFVCVFVWIWYQSNAVLIEWIWKHSFLFIKKKNSLRRIDILLYIFGRICQRSHLVLNLGCLNFDSISLLIFRLFVLYFFLIQS